MMRRTDRKSALIARVGLLTLAGILPLNAFAQVPANSAPSAEPGCSFQELRGKLHDRLATMTPPERQGAEAILKMIAADFRLSYIAREVRINPNGKETEAWVRRDAGRGFRVDSIRPSGEIFVDDRKNFYMFQPKKNQWLQRPSVMNRARGFMEDLSRRLGKSQLRAVREGQDTIAGRIADIVRVAPSGSEGGPARRFWIDRQTGLRLKQEVVGQDGRLQNSSYFLSVDLNPTFRPDDFSAPTGNVVVIADDRKTYKTLAEANQAGIAPRVPAYLPNGFALRVVEVSKNWGDWDHKGEQDDSNKREGKRGKRITQRYANGLTVLSLVQVPAEDQPGEALSSAKGKFKSNPRGGGERAFVWRDAEFRYILIGSLADEETRRVADSVK